MILVGKKTHTLQYIQFNCGTFGIEKQLYLSPVIFGNIKLKMNER